MNNGDLHNNQFNLLVEYLITGTMPYCMDYATDFEESGIVEMMSGYKSLGEIYEYFQSEDFNHLLRILSPSQMVAVKLILGYVLLTRVCGGCNKTITSKLIT